jgi:NAD-dependent SIR2 family protein deacetylase
MQIPLADDFQRAADLIDQTDGLLICAGAGMGVDSGLPDFRGNEGFWKAYPALAKARLSFTDIASPDTFRSDARLAWGFYGHRLALYRRTIPHEGFQILRQIAQRIEHGAFVFTSNVDGQFQKSGFDPSRIHECHGSIHHLQCTSQCIGRIWSADGFLPEVDESLCSLTNSFPACPECGAVARPNILMFGDYDWIEHRSAQQGFALKRWLGKLEHPLVIELGAGTQIATVRRLSEQHGRQIIRINPTEPEVGSTRGISLRMGALAGLEGIAQALGLDLPEAFSISELGEVEEITLRPLPDDAQAFP